MQNRQQVRLVTIGRTIVFVSKFLILFLLDIKIDLRKNFHILIHLIVNNWLASKVTLLFSIYYT